MSPIWGFAQIHALQKLEAILTGVAFHVARYYAQLPRTIYGNKHIFWSCKFLSSLHLTWLRRTGESQYTPPFLRRTCPASALVGLEIPLLLVVIPGGERHERTTFHSGCSCWSGNGCHQRFHPRLLNRSRARTIFNVNVILNCKAERDNTNANKHDICSCSCIYILKRDCQINSCAINTYKYWRLCL